MANPTTTRQHPHQGGSRDFRYDLPHNAKSGLDVPVLDNKGRYEPNHVSSSRDQQEAFLNAAADKLTRCNSRFSVQLEAVDKP